MDIRKTEHRGWIGWRMTGEWSDQSPDTVGGKEAATKKCSLQNLFLFHF